MEGFDVPVPEKGRKPHGANAFEGHLRQEGKMPFKQSLSLKGGKINKSEGMSIEYGNGDS